VLEAYNREHLDATDVAIELPTGTGKTLIGLLIAEYRRRRFEERVVYLCPTRQLVHQVVERSRQCGIGATALLPPLYEGINDYRLSQCVGVATYSGLFNIRPRIDDPQFIVLDDTHGAENYIAQPWALSIKRRNHPQVYEGLLDCVAPAMQPVTAKVYQDPDPPPSVLGRVDLVPLPRWWAHKDAIADLLDHSLPRGTDPAYTWPLIRENLEACSLFVSWNQVLIRPSTPPTHTHGPFTGALQRVYMSATLGEGGELERITGVRHIERIPVPEDWERQSSGRRLFLFPDRDLGREESAKSAVACAAISDRALVLTPSMTTAERAAEQLREAGIDTLTARDVEESLDPFSTATGIALVLANRYDGLDLPDESCRLLLLVDLPIGVNLQELFFYTKLGATALLRDRIQTRISQGAGRCCRNSTDFAAVIVVGQRLFDFLARHENRSALHPELQAEIEFGLQNSEGQNPDGFVQLLKLFYEQGQEWEAADDEIIRLRAERKKQVDAVTTALRQIVSSEVEFTRCLWRRDFQAAADAAWDVADNLPGDEVKGCRAWWYYQAGCSAWLQAQETGEAQFKQGHRDCFARASRCATGIGWLASLARCEGGQEDSEVSPEELRIYENALDRLQEAGFAGSRFQRDTGDLLESIAKDEADSFEHGLELLGSWLGFDASRPDASGAPDSVWIFSDHLALAFEAKSEETPEDAISLSAVRQARTHEQWVRDNHSIASDAQVVTVVVSARTVIGQQARSNAAGLHYVHISETRDLAKKCAAAMRRARSATVGAERAEALRAVREQLEAEGITPCEVTARLQRHPMQDMSVA